jgi:hypothetical protein
MTNVVLETFVQIRDEISHSERVDENVTASSQMRRGDL